MFDLIEARRAGAATMIAAVVILLAAGLALAGAVTVSEKATCTPDAVRLCASSFPDVKATTACMVAHNSQLSAGCRAVMDRHAPKPVAARAVHHAAVPAPRARPTAPPHAAVPQPPAPAVAEPVHPVLERPAEPVAKPTPKPERHHPMLTLLHDLWNGLSWSSLILIGVALYLAKTKGWPWILSVGTTIAGWWNKGVTDLKAAQTALAGEVAVVKADVSNIASHLVGTGQLPATLAPTTTATSAAVAAVAAAAPAAKPAA